MSIAGTHASARPQSPLIVGVIVILLEGSEATSVKTPSGPARSTRYPADGSALTALFCHRRSISLADTPAALKASVPGSNVIEVQFEHPPAELEQRLRSLPHVTSVQHEGAGMYRVLTSNGSATTTALVEMAVHGGIPVKTLTVQSTTLDDVFVQSFQNTNFNLNGGGTFAGNIVTDGIAQRRLEFGAKIIF